MRKLITILLLLTPLLSIGMVKDTTWKPVAIMYQNEYGQYSGKWIKGADIQEPTNPGAPVVNVGDNKELPFNQTSLVLDGSSSYSPGGTALTSFLWEKVSGNNVVIVNPNSQTTTVTGLMPGDYVFRLTVTDADNLTNSKDLHIKVNALPSAAYYVIDSALFNFTPVAQNINGYTDIIGDPSISVLSATSSNGITISTVSTSSWTANPDSGSSALWVGMPYTTPADPFNYIDFDSAAIVTGFENYNSEYTDGVYNIRVSGLDPESKYQFIITGSKYDPGVTGAPVYETRSRFHLSDGQIHNMNTVFATSREIKFDTIKPGQDGTIELSVTGQDKSYPKGSAGIISALKVYEISKDEGTGNLTYQYQHFYDTLYINDGYRNRLCVVAPPYNYDPEKTYPILMYFGGGESAVEDGDWDPEVAVTEGAGFAIQHYQGNVYGIDESGDTIGFIILIPQNLNTVPKNESLNNPTVIDNILTRFKSRTKYNYNSNLYMGGFSMGALITVDYILSNPNSVKAAYIASPIWVPWGYPDYSTVTSWAKTLTSSSVKMYMMYRPDVSQAFSGNFIDTLQKYAPENIYTNHWNRGHSGFAWEWTMDTTNNYASQTVYDWFVNPDKGNPTVSKFAFAPAAGVTIPTFTGIVNSRYNDQTVTDPNTGVTLSTVKANWGNTPGSSLGNYTVTGLINYSYGLENNIYRNAGYGKNVSGGYTNGPNMTLSNLTPNHSYTIFFDGFGENGGNNYAVMYYNGGADNLAWKQSLIHAERSRMKRIDVKSDDNGKIDLGFYPSSVDGNGKAYLNYMVIREN